MGGRPRSPQRGSRRCRRRRTSGIADRRPTAIAAAWTPAARQRQPAHRRRRAPALRRPRPRGPGSRTATGRELAGGTQRASMTTRPCPPPPYTTIDLAICCPSSQPVEHVAQRVEGAHVEARPPSGTHGVATQVRRPRSETNRPTQRVGQWSSEGVAPAVDVPTSTWGLAITYRPGSRTRWPNEEAVSCDAGQAAAGATSQTP